MDPSSLSVEEASANTENEQEDSERIEENEQEASSNTQGNEQGSFTPIKLKKAPEIAVCTVAMFNCLVERVCSPYAQNLIYHFPHNGTEPYVTKEQTDWMETLDPIWVSICALLTGFLMDTVGRFRILQIGAICCAIGWILFGFATNATMLLVGHLLSVLAIVLMTLPMTVYITEVAEAKKRSLLIAIGIIPASLEIMLSHIEYPAHHRQLVSCLSIIFMVGSFIGMRYYVTESPVWLVLEGRIDEAKKSLEWIYKNKTSQGEKSMAETQLDILTKKIKSSNQQQNKLGSAFNKLRGFLKPTGWKPMVILFMLFAFQQFSGMSITLSFAVHGFKKVSANDNKHATPSVVGIHMLCCVVNIWLLRRYKKRSLCIISSLGMMVCMIVSGYFTLKMKNDDNNGYDWELCRAICLLLYVCMSVGMFTIPWIMAAELFPTEIRGIAYSIIYSMANLFTFAVKKSLQDSVRKSYEVQWSFAGVFMGAAVFVLLMLPETHEKELWVIEEYFHNNCLAEEEQIARSSSTELLNSELRKTRF